MYCNDYKYGKNIRDQPGFSGGVNKILMKKTKIFFIYFNALIIAVFCLPLLIVIAQCPPLGSNLLGFPVRASED